MDFKFTFEFQNNIDKITIEIFDKEKNQIIFNKEISKEPVENQIDNLNKRETPLMTGREAAAYLKIGKSTLYSLVKRGEIPVIYVGKTMRFSKDELNRKFNENL